MGLPKCPFLTRGYELAKRKAYDKYQNFDFTKDEMKEHVHKYVQEEMLKVNQARLADRLDRVTAWRLSEEGQSKVTDSSDIETGTCGRKFGTSKKSKKFGISRKSKSRKKDCFDNKLMMDKKSKIIELAGVTIFPKVGGQDAETIVGILQSHVNGFIYATSSSDLNVSFLYKNVKKLLFLAEDEKKMPPLLHFDLGCPIKVGTEKRESIQFRLVPTCRRSDDDSLKSFVFKVENKWRCLPKSHYPFDELDNKFEFSGVGTSKARYVFRLAICSLFGLADADFLVINLRDIEIVNLAKGEPKKIEPEEIHMTVVYKDFKLNPLQINSIPIHSLDGIKQGLDFGNVKYYVNDKKQDWWGPRVKQIANSPEKFIEQGGWKSFGLEDPATLDYYNCHKESKECDSGEVCYAYNSEGSKVVVNDSDIED